MELFKSFSASHLCFQPEGPTNSVKLNFLGSSFLARESPKCVWQLRKRGTITPSSSPSSVSIISQLSKLTPCPLNPVLVNTGPFQNIREHQQ